MRKRADEDALILKKLWPHLTVQQIADAMGRSLDAVQNRASRLGLKKTLAQNRASMAERRAKAAPAPSSSRPLGLNHESVEMLRSLRGGSMDSEQVAARFRTSPPDIAAMIREGLIERADGFYTITDRGRKLCPPRNPASVRRG